MIDNSSVATKKILASIIQNNIPNLETTDICELDENDSVFKGAKYIFHYAGIETYVPSIEKPSIDYMNTNVQTVRVLEALVMLA